MESSRPPPMRIQHLADFKPQSSSRAWVSIPNPNNLPLIATATSDKTVRVYSLTNFTLHSTLEGGHERSVRSAAWKPGVRQDGALTIATGSFDATMGIWRRKEEQKISADEDELEVEVARDGIVQKKPQLIGGDEDGSSDEGDDWEFSVVLEGHDSEIKNVAFSPSGQWLASCSRDKSIWIWEEIGEEGEDEFETVAVLQEHTADVKCDDGNGEVLASASYDDTIILWREDGEGEWGAVATIEGHEGTVWSLEWEPSVCMTTGDENESSIPPTQRLMSASADMTIRVWSRVPTPPPPNKPSYFNPGIPSTMRPAPENETWECTAVLPKVHDLPIYSISWSQKSGRVASTGGDGRVAIYEERSKGRTSVGGPIEKEWVVIAMIDGAHGPYEINHITWCTRFDSGRKGDEEMIVTTGDDGFAKAWTINEIMAS
ncbi:putative cytosolic iron-sulfur assembly 1 protein [Rutstroemia sp. NJR-2017a WRK4]|nr:putative cytosolic iron-sulfur assembly 1 protein [Rutstroemia sp. NJR-2017a WRK4]